MVATTTRLTWKQRALQRVQSILATLPADATDNQKRLALRLHAPSRYAPATERRAWQAAVRDALGPARTARPVDLKTPSFLDTGDETLNGLLAGYRDNPTDSFRRLVIADRLEELGQEGRARLVRAIKPNVEDVARRLWPWSYLTHVSRTAHDTRKEVRSAYGGFIMSARDLCDMMEGRTLLVDPQVAEATEIERALAVLRLFEEKP